MVALVKAHPERYSYGTWGNGSSAHLTTEWLKKTANIKMTHVPYKTTPQIVNDLASGVLQIGWSDPGTPVPMIEAGKIRGIAISGNNRVPRTQAVPTMGEQGFQFDAVGWFGLFAPAGTPKAVIDRLHQESVAALNSPDIKERLGALGAEVVASTPEQLADLMQREETRYTKMVRDLQIKPD